MKRFLAIHLPYWPVYCSRKSAPGARNPFCIIHSKNAQQVQVRYVSEAAEKCSVHSGMSLELARALLPRRPLLFEENHLLYIHSLYRLSLWALRFSPFVACDGEIVAAYKQNNFSSLSALSYGLILDISGTERLHKGEQQLCERILNALSRAGIQAYLAIASSSSAAQAFARSSLSPENAIRIFSSENFHEEVKKLSLDFLRLGGSKKESLKEIGLSNIGDLLCLPRKQLLSRFGMQLLLCLDQLLGYSEEALAWIHPKQQIFVERHFPFPLERKEALHISLEELLRELLFRLSKAKLQAAAFLFSFEGIDERRSAEESFFSIRKELRLSQASASTAHIRSVIFPFLETLKVPSGVSLLRIDARHCCTADEEQENAFGHPSLRVSQAEKKEFLNLLNQKLGPRGVNMVKVTEDYFPEKAFSFSPASNGAFRISESLPEQDKFYPAKIFKKPEALLATALLPDRPPSQIIYRGIKTRICQGIGPERISPPWWEEDQDEEREYFTVQDEHGNWFWIYRGRQSMQWFLHGVWG